MSGPRFVQGKAGNKTGAGDLTIAFDGNNTAGNLIIIAVTTTNTTKSVTGITDTNGNMYAPVSAKITTTTTELHLWYAYNIAAGVNTVTVAWDGGALDPIYVVILEYTGIVVAVDPLDKENSATGLAGTAADSGNTTNTAQAVELVFGVTALSGTFTDPVAGNGFTLRTASNRLIVEDKSVAAIDAYNATCSWTTARNWCCQVATFRGTSPLAHPMPSHGGQARHGYTLTLKPSVISTIGSATPTDLTDLARDWMRSTRLQGGYWSGTFTMPYTKRAIEAFNTWMGCHVEERSGGVVSWEGQVYEMELTAGGVVRRRSFDTMANRVKATYTDPVGTAQETAWIEDMTSQARYGIKEEVLDLGVMVDVTAAALARKYLAEHAWPYARGVAVAPASEERLSITVNGYVFTLNWVYSSLNEYKEGPLAGGPYGTFTVCPNPGCPCAAPGSAAFEDPAAYAAWHPYETNSPADARYSMWFTEDIAGNKFYAYIGEVTDVGGNTYVHLYKVQDFNPLVPGDHGYLPTGAPGGGHGADEYWVRGIMSDWVLAVGASAPFLDRGIAQTNMLPVKRDVDGSRVWDALYQAVRGDVDGHPWRLWVGNGRCLFYEELSATPRWTYRDGVFLDAGGNPVNPWALTPAVVRNLRWSFGAEMSGAWLTDPRDFLVDEFQVNAAGVVTPRMADVDPSEFMVYYTKAMNEGLANKPREQRNPWGGGPMPPNWNVEAGTYNPPGPGGDLNGYWTEPSPGYFVWVHQMGLPGQPGS